MIVFNLHMKMSTLVFTNTMISLTKMYSFIKTESLLLVVTILGLIYFGVIVTSNISMENSNI